MMKWGIVTSLGLVFVFCLIAYFAFFGIADAPTSQTSPSSLAAVSLPADLPKLYTPTNPDEDASVPYVQAFRLYLKHRDAFNLIPESPPPKELSKLLIDKMIEAMNAGKVPESFLDKQVRPSRYWASRFPGSSLVARNRCSRACSSCFS